MTHRITCDVSTWSWETRELLQHWLDEVEWTEWDLDFEMTAKDSNMWDPLVRELTHRGWKVTTLLDYRYVNPSVLLVDSGCEKYAHWRLSQP